MRVYAQAILEILDKVLPIGILVIFQLIPFFIEYISLGAHCRYRESIPLRRSHTGASWKSNNESFVERIPSVSSSLRGSRVARRKRRKIKGTLSRCAEKCRVSRRGPRIPGNRVICSQTSRPSNLGGGYVTSSKQREWIYRIQRTDAGHYQLCPRMLPVFLLWSPSRIRF